MLNAQDSQFRLQEDGQIYFQKDVSNPMPGQLLAYLAKGDSILAPRVVLFESELVKADEKATVREHVQSWLGRHIQSVLDPLPALTDAEGMKGPARGIAFQVHESLGIVPREQVEDLIAGLDQDDRKALRDKRVRLGPILVFIPALNKPAAVRLRALLWGLHNEKPLPMQCPKDGIVSFVPQEQPVDKAFYQSIGYPVFGGRAIRIDMLDRVINAVYDSAKEGKFQAQHKMAEWLGSSIDGLYEVLEAMGHKKIDAPAAEAEQAAPPQESTGEGIETPAQDVAAKAPVETLAETVPRVPPSDVAESAVLDASSKEADTKAQEKPALAYFRLKKGKAFVKAGGAHKKPFDKKPGQGFKKSSDSERSRGDRHKHKRDKKPQRDQGPKIIQAGPSKPRLEDSPFAILEQLKKKSDG